MLKKFLLTCISFFSSIIFISAQDWKTYPYHPIGSSIHFPTDEGRHPTEPTEWWYTNAQVKGNITGNKYSIMLAYFYYPTFLIDGFRVFNIANETLNQFYTQTLYCNYSNLANDHLHIKAQPVGSIEEEWITVLDSSGKLEPFEYYIFAVSHFGEIKARINAVKRPLIMGGNGFVYQGTSGYTNYYSQTMLNLTGTLTLNGITESITGTTWIDHQYGKMKSVIDEKYEWFSIQLSNGMDLNIWTIFYGQNQLPNTSNYKICGIHISELKDTTISNFNLTRLKYSFMPNSAFCYSQQWHFVWEGIDLIITTNQNNCEVLSPVRFYEGSTTIQGMVDGVPVTGIGFAELLHPYENPKIKFIKTTGNRISNDSIKIVWELLNPDEGRPIFYDLEFSNDNGITFIPIVQRLTNTSFDWDSTGSEAGSSSLLRVTGYSIDGTLRGNDIITIGTEKNETVIQPDFYLMQNYPNPFNYTTFIKFNLPQASKVNLSIYNSLGELIIVIADGEYEVGVYERVFNASELASGIYVYVLKAAKLVLRQKMVLMK